jgi:hypothetical protein
VGDIDFEVISATENSNKFQKTRFLKEKSVENMVTLVPRANGTATLVHIRIATSIAKIGGMIHVTRHVFHKGF